MVIPFLPLPATGPLVAGGEPLAQRRLETAQRIVNAAPRQHRPEMLAVVNRFFPRPTAKPSLRSR